MRDGEHPLSCGIKVRMSEKYRKQSHCVYRCDYHIVVSTKYRRKILNEGVFAYFKIKVREIGKYYPDIVFKEINYDIDHIHMLVSIPPKYSISKVITIFKSNTSRGIKQKFPFLKDVYWGADGIWSDGYFVDTVGVNAEVIRQYIEHQGQQDTGQSKIEFC